MDTLRIDKLLMDYSQSFICRCATVLLVAVLSNHISFAGPIQNAAANGDLAWVKELLQANPGLISSTNYQYYDGFTPLLAAAAYDHLDVIAFLLSQNSDVNAADIDRSWTALHYAAKNGNAAAVKLLIANKANVNAKGRRGDTPLHMAAENDHKDVVDVLLANHAEVDNIFDAAAIGDLDKVKTFLKDNPALITSQINFGITPLHIAAWHGQKQVAEFLLENKADVNANTSDRRSPLHLAAQYGHTDLVELLLTNHADINAKTGYRETPLHLAAMNGKNDVVDALALHKADYNIFDAAAIGDLERIKTLLKQNIDLGPSTEQYGNTPLHTAAITGQKDAAALLIANHAAVDAGDSCSATPLQDAALHGHVDVVELLLANKANVNARDKDGHTPLMMAAAGGHADVVDLLLRNHADPNAKDTSGQASIFNAVRGHHNDVVKLLLDAKADPNVRYFDGTTSLQIAEADGDISTIDLLRQHGAK